MKKLNVSFLKAVSAAFFCLIYFASCKSMEQSIPSVDALALLEENSAVYFKIPVAKHSEFAKKLLCYVVPGLTEKNADYIIPKINTICAGLGNINDKNDMNRVQVSLEGNIPPLAVKTALSEKKGWTLKKSSVNSKIAGISVPHVYYERKDTDYKLALASLKNFVFSKDVEPLLQRYEVQLDSLAETGFVMVPGENWVASTYEWMTETTDEMRFCVLYPQGFLKNLLGRDMKFAIVCARGSLTDNNDGSYNLALNIDFENRFVLTAAKAALSLVYGKNAKIETSSETLKVFDIRLTTEDVLELFGGSMR